METEDAAAVLREEPMAATLKSTSDGNTTYRQKKKKEKEREMASLLSWKDLTLEVTSLASTVLLMVTLVIFCKTVMYSADRLGNYQETMVIDRPATSIKGSDFVVVSSNEYCNYIIEEVLERGFPASVAGRVMFMCLYANLPHLISPHGQQMYLTLDKFGEVTGSAINQQRTSINWTSSIEKDEKLMNLLKEGKYSIGMSDNIAFQRRLFELSGRDESDKAMEIFRVRSNNYMEIPVVHSLEETIQAEKFNMRPLECPQYFTSWRRVVVDAEMVDQSYLMRYLQGKRQNECNRGDNTTCEQLHEEYYESIRQKYSKSRNKLLENLFKNISEFVPIENGNENVRKTGFRLRGRDMIYRIPKLAGLHESVLASIRHLIYTFSHGEDDTNLVPYLLRELNIVDADTASSDAMVGFVIVDKNRDISIGAGGMRKKAGSVVCHQGTFLDSNNVVLGAKTDEFGYFHRFIPILQMSHKNKRVQTATLIVAKSRKEAIQQAANIIQNGIDRKEETPFHAFPRILRSPVIMMPKTREYEFVKGMTYKTVRQLKKNLPFDSTFREIGWDAVHMDVLGVEMNSTYLKAYFMDRNGEFAAMAVNNEEK